MCSITLAEPPRETPAQSRLHLPHPHLSKETTARSSIRAAASKSPRLAVRQEFWKRPWDAESGQPFLGGSHPQPTIASKVSVILKRSHRVGGYRGRDRLRGLLSPLSSWGAESLFLGGITTCFRVHERSADPRLQVRTRPEALGYPLRLRHFNVTAHL
jgi:hypothetical protein